MINEICPSELVDENPNCRAQAPLDFVKNARGVRWEGEK